MVSIFGNIHFWLLLAFSVFIIIFYLKARFHINSFLDSKIDNIKYEITKSEKLLKDALKLLSYQKKETTKLNNKNNNLILKLKNDADSHYEKMVTQLKIEIKNQKKSFTNYLHNSEHKIISKINSKIIGSGIKNVENILSTSLSQMQHDNLISKSIENINNLFKNQSR